MPFQTSSCQDLLSSTLTKKMVGQLLTSDVQELPKPPPVVTWLHQAGGTHWGGSPWDENTMQHYGTLPFQGFQCDSQIGDHRHNDVSQVMKMTLEDRHI